MDNPRPVMENVATGLAFQSLASTVPCTSASEEKPPVLCTIVLARFARSALFAHAEAASNSHNEKSPGVPRRPGLFNRNCIPLPLREGRSVCGGDRPMR
jgi:hypothetical protein